MKIFNNEMFEVSVKSNNGEILFDAENVARNLGLTTIAKSGNVTVRWGRVNSYLPKNSPQVGKGSFIPESLVYKLVFKSNNEVAEKFQDWLAIEVIPSIRKTGGFVNNEDLFVETYLPTADEQTKLMFKATLENVRKANEKISILQPKAEYFDALVDRNLLTNFRDTAKELEITQKVFINWLLENNYIYRDKKQKLKPYAQYGPVLFKIKDWKNDIKSDVQTLITPKGKETFRLLINK